MIILLGWFRNVEPELQQKVLRCSASPASGQPTHDGLFNRQVQSAAVPCCKGGGGE